MRPTAVCIILSLGMSICWAVLHYFYFRPKINNARMLSSKFLYEYQEKKRLENEAKIQNL
ncbi:hypothetical protein GCM10011498_05990 [Amylibacter cionae]|uniref:Uncharacterized protein n=2 Tax=Neptunicoccus cionae TaxID=2035344 RepID=A0A916QRW5_9RHOB|nr:hypothetical protein GCM10011498_05990 [Amylibacter cionae]